MSRTVIIIATMLCAGCGDCTREVQDVPYRGDATAIDPYVETVGVEVMPGSCDEAGCVYFVTATAWLHNPLDVAYTASVRCEFMADDYLMGESTRADITIDALRSKELQFQEQHTTADTVSFSAVCELIP